MPAGQLNATRQTTEPTPIDLGPVVVTGGASGLGAAVADAVAGAGGTPVVLDLHPSPTGHASTAVDLADARAAERAVAAVAEAHGGLGAVVTSAGIDACGKLADVDAERWDRVVAVNLLGTAAVVRAAVPYLERTRGRIVTVASTLGYRALSDATAYCASKFGVVGFSRALQLELAGRVGVTLLIPGGMQTRFFDDRDPQYKPGPDADLQGPQDVAGAVLFALTRPRGSEVRELVVTAPTEPSWP
jgi:NAD(P)-dependent dehydrogenase (short-subunit alcohol dehydrogenase family)